MVTLALAALLSATPSTLERDFPRATLWVRPGESTVAIAIGLDGEVPESEAGARTFVQRYGGAFGVLPEDELVLTDQRGDGFGTTFRFERHKAGAPVHQAEVVVTFDGRHRVVMVHAGAQVPPAKGSFVRPPPRANSSRAWVRDGAALRPAWVTTRTLEDGATLWEAEDAETGQGLGRHEIRWQANGRVYDFSPARDASGLCPLVADGGYRPCAQTVLRPLGNLTTLSGPRAVGRNCLGQGSGTGCLPRAMPNAQGDFDFMPNLGTSTMDTFSEVTAYYQADRFSAWVDGLSPPFQTAGGLGVVDVFTNVGNYEGGFFMASGPFNRMGIRLGQQLADWSYDADIIHHELGHAVVNRTSRFSFYSRDMLGVNADPGGLNEGTADYLALSLKGFPQLGENVASRVMEGGGNIDRPYVRTLETRRMCQVTSIPAATNVAIGGRVGQVHADGTIWATFLWTLRERLATVSTSGRCMNCNATDIVVMRALDSLGSGASFNEATLAVQQQAASQFGNDAAQLVGCMRCEWDMPSCDGRLRIVYPNETHEALLVDGSSAGSFGGITPAGFQYALDVPANTGVVFNRFAIESGTLTIRARFGGPIQWAGSGSNATHTITAQGQTLPAQAAAGRWYIQGSHDGGAIRRYGFRVSFLPAGNATMRPAPPALTCSLGSGVPSSCSCVPQCTGRQCGPDGCGGSCGTCPMGQTCSASSRCGCVPQCAGKQCGDDGCGGSCGQCAAGRTCSAAGVCQCAPSCTGRTCGDDGCGGSCGTCGNGQFCSPAGACMMGANPCQGKTCGPDGRGGVCGACQVGQSCNAAGQCIAESGSCAGKACGPDGMGGSCGTCPSPFMCAADGSCVATVAGCGTRLCGPDGLGGSCGTCDANEACTENGTCVKVEPPPKGCGCTGSSVGPALLGLVFALARRRRRPPGGVRGR